MLDIDAIITGQPGAPRLSDLLSMAEKGHEDSAQSGMDSKVVSHLEMQTSKDGVQAPT